MSSSHANFHRGANVRGAYIHTQFMSNILCRRLLFTSRGEIFGQWNVEFTYTWAELKEKPKLSAKGIEVCLKEKEKKKFLFGSSTSKKEIHISDKKLAEVLSVCMQV